MKKYDTFTLTESATQVALLTDIHRYAFTLAEVLITLGIIGVVAAMTMPSLIQNKQKKELETAFKNHMLISITHIIKLKLMNRLYGMMNILLIHILK